MLKLLLFVGLFAQKVSAQSAKSNPGGGPPGGIVDAIAIDPHNTDTLYAGTLGKGAFKSTNGGASWTAVNSGLTNTYVNVLAIDPSNTPTVYAGTAGVGVFKSKDGGATWLPTGSDYCPPTRIMGNSGQGPDRRCANVVPRLP